jgi:hypothetical protein
MRLSSYVSAPCVVLPEIKSDAAFTVATYASALGLLQLSYFKIMEEVLNRSLIGCVSVTVPSVVILAPLTIRKL